MYTKEEMQKWIVGLAAFMLGTQVISNADGQSAISQAHIQKAQQMKKQAMDKAKVQKMQKMGNEVSHAKRKARKSLKVAHKKSSRRKKTKRS